MILHSEELFDLIRRDEWRMDVLKTARDMGLPDAWVGAGFVRSLVWDHLSGHTDETPLRDVDVVYFDPANTDEAFEKDIDKRLSEKMPGVPWSCKNQARMHLKFGVGAPYKSTEDGLRHWLETSAAIAVRMDGAGQLHVLAPFGLEDLFNLRIQPTPYARAHKMDDYKGLAAKKNWQSRWPRLVIGA